MTATINKVILIGHVGNEPEIRTTPEGAKVANFPLATSDSWKNSDGKKQHKTEWHKIVIFNESLVNIVKDYVHKGSKLYIEGSLATRKWVNKKGDDQYTTEILLRNYANNLSLLDKLGDKKDVDPPPTED